MALNGGGSNYAMAISPRKQVCRHFYRQELLQDSQALQHLFGVKIQYTFTLSG
jgi:hypothetical protein